MIAIRGEIQAVIDGKADPKDNVLKNAPHTAAAVAADDVVASVFARTGGVSAAVRPRAQVLAERRPHRQSVRRPQSDVRLPAGGRRTRRPDLQVGRMRVESSTPDLKVGPTCRRPATAGRAGVRALAEAGQERVGHRPWLAGPDRPVVDLHDRHDLARRARQKRFVGAEQIVVSQHLLADGNADRRADLEQELARDARQQARIDAAASAPRRSFTTKRLAVVHSASSPR